MIKILIVITILFFGCVNNNSGKSEADTSHVTITDSINNVGDSNTKADATISPGKSKISSDSIDTLTKEEKTFLTNLSKENEFIILSKEVQRYYSKENNSLLFSKLLYTKSSLQEKGYVFFELMFYGKISDVNLSYVYNMGQASYGVGSVIGIDIDNYVHTIKSCGVTSCITQVYQNGKKVFESDGN